MITMDTGSHAGRVNFPGDGSPVVAKQPRSHEYDFPNFFIFSFAGNAHHGLKSPLHPPRLFTLARTVQV